ncbi:MAG: hypothetical protein R3A51_12500 [Nannocystaceae bacterium]
MLIRSGAVSNTRSSPARRATGCILAALLGASACASSGEGAPLFPTAREIASLAKEPAPSSARVFADMPVFVDRWTLQGPLPEVTSALSYAGDEPLAVRARQLAAPRGGRVTESMQCVARQYGAFFLAHGGSPPDDLKHFIAARCGAPVSEVAVRYVMRTLPAGAAPPDASEWGALEVLRSATASVGRDDELGVWAGTQDQKYALVFVTGRSEVALEPTPIVGGEGGFVELRGRIRRPVGWIQAYATRGEYDYRVCRPIDGAAFGERDFAMRCPVASDDSLAMIEVVAAEPERVLGRTILRVAVSPDGSAPDSFAPRPSRSRASDSHGPGDLLAAINELRGGLRLDPLKNEARQSALVDSLIPHFLAARAEPDGEDTREKIALGMMAGWEVEGFIRDSSFLVLRSHASRSMDRAVAEALSSPFARAILLDPEARSIALATRASDVNEAVASMLFTYEFFDRMDYKAEESAFVVELNAQRRARGLKPIVHVIGAEPREILGRGVRTMMRGAATPLEALNEALHTFVVQTSRNFQGAVYSTHKLEGWKPRFSPELLTATDVELAIRIGHYTPAGAAWGQHVALVVFTVLSS